MSLYPDKKSVMHSGFASFFMNTVLHMKENVKNKEATKLIKKLMSKYTELESLASIDLTNFNSKITEFLYKHKLNYAFYFRRVYF